MIFATVGSQLPFDRLTHTLDVWAQKTKNQNAFAQIGKGKSLRFLHSARTLSSSQFAKMIADCSVILSHAGMGTVLTALEAQKPIILLARRCALGEHRNDHQLATVDRLRGRPGIHVADTEDEMVALLERRDTLSAPSASHLTQDAPLIAAIQNFVEEA